MKVLVAEGGSTWLPYVLQQLDWHVDQVIANAGAHLSMLPSDYARRLSLDGFLKIYISNSC